MLGEKEAVSALEQLNASQTNKKKSLEIYRKACEIDVDYAQRISESSFKNIYLIFRVIQNQE